MANKLISSNIGLGSLLALLLLAIPVHGQGVARTEDYEDATVGGSPPTVSDWYTATSTNTFDLNQIVTPGYDGTDKALDMRCVCSGSNLGVVRYTLNESFQPSNFSIFIQIINEAFDLDSNTVSFQDTDGDTGVYFNLGDLTGAIEFNNPSGAGAGCTGSFSTENYVSPNAVHEFLLTFNWAAQTYTMDIDGGAQSFTKPFCEEATDVANFCFSVSAEGPSCGNTGGQGHFRFDQLEFDSGQIPPGPPGPPENYNFLDPNSTGQDLADALNIPVAALDTWIAWMLVFIFMAAGFWMARGVGASIGAGAGLIIAFALGRFSLTFLFFTGMLAAAAGIVLMKRGGRGGGG